jgi:cell filamentation protein, protein adenylyltransferase
MSDPYIDAQSGILRNRFGLTDQKSLDRAEADVVSARSILLQLNPLKGNFDSEHLKAIHSYLFRDVYVWAGQFRTIPLAKAEDIRGERVIRFSSPDLIEEELKQVFDELAAEHFLEGLPRREFARKIAALFSEINRIHPFREGNGRTQRQFVRQLADSLGYKLHFEVVSKERLVQASILSANGDTAMMERLLDEITETERIQPLVKVIGHLERNDFNSNGRNSPSALRTRRWNDVYLATTARYRQPGPKGRLGERSRRGTDHQLLSC